jgi:phosphate-selective porin
VDLEWAAVCGPLSVSAEYAVAWGGDVFERFERGTFSGPRGQATYHAAYVEAGYFVTPGDHRRYDRKRGFWARTLPQENAFLARGEDGRWCRGRGAVQLLARYSYLDLVSGNPVLTPASGGARAGRQHDVTLGATWYINSQTWVMLNYVWTHIDSVAPGASGDFQGIGCRLHLDF